jgi:hypothetical protein
LDCAEQGSGERRPGLSLPRRHAEDARACSSRFRDEHARDGALTTAFGTALH